MIANDKVVPGFDLVFVNDIWDPKHWPETLAPNHVQYLAMRAVAPAVAAARGYGSGCGFDQLVNMTFADNPTRWAHLEQHMYSMGDRATFLVIPLYHHDNWVDDDGDATPTTFQVRLDAPRPDVDAKTGRQKIDAHGVGKIKKFENPAGVIRGPELGDMPLDVNPAADFHLPCVRLLVCEGPLKADSVLSAELAMQTTRLDHEWVLPVCVTGTPMPYVAVKDDDGRTISHKLSPAWEPILDAVAQIELDDEGVEVRRWIDTKVTVAYDSDWAQKYDVHRDAVVTGVACRKAGFTTDILSLPEVPGLGAKTGIDDLLFYVWNERHDLYPTYLTHLITLSTISLDDAITRFEKAPRPRTRKTVGHAVAGVQSRMAAARAAARAPYKNGVAS